VTAEPQPKHDPFAALRQPAFVLYSLNRVFAAVGTSLLNAVMAWQVYALSGNVLDLGYLALARFLASLATSLIGGVVADTFDRRIVMATASIVPFTCAAVLSIATLGGWVELELIFGLVILTGFASSFEQPARQALLPAIVRPETFANAVAVSNTVQRLGSITGPTLAGFLIDSAGIGTSYIVFCVTAFIASMLLLVLRYDRVTARRSASVKAAFEGLTFVRRNQPVLGAMSIDMFATIFGGAAALLPIYATDILKVGPSGFGILQSASQAGAFAISLVLVMRPAVRQTGRVLVYSVAAYGIATVAFGFSREFWMAVLFYGVLGVFDQISVVMRQQIIQMATPDELRGRVSAVYQVFLGASNQGGAIESAFVAAVTGATFAVVSGGVLATTVAGYIGWKMPKLFNYTSDQDLPTPVDVTPKPAVAR